MSAMITLLYVFYVYILYAIAVHFRFIFYDITNYIYIQVDDDDGWTIAFIECAINRPKKIGIDVSRDSGK